MKASRSADATGVSRRYTVWGAYGLAVGLVTATLVPMLALRSWIGQQPLLVPFVIPIILSAYVGGFATGLFATVLVAFTTAYFVLGPEMSFSFEQPVSLVHWTMLWVTGVLASALVARGGTPAASDSEPADRALALTEWQVRGGVVLALTCLGVIGTVSYLSVVRLNDAATSVAHTQQVLGSLNAIREAVADAETAQRGYVMSGDDSYLEPFGEAARGIEAKLQRLRAVTRDDSRQQQRLEALAPLVTGRVQDLGKGVELRRSAGFEEARQAITTGPGKARHHDMRRLLQEMTATEASLLGQRQRSVEHSSVVARAVIVVGGMIALAVVGVALFGLRRDFADRRYVDRVMRAAQDDLETRVRERTAELERSACSLEEEVVARRGDQQKLQSQLQRLNLLQQITRAIGERQDLPSIFSVVLGTLEEHLPVDFCCVCLRDATQTHLTVASIGPRGTALASELALTNQARIEIAENGLSRCMRGYLVYEPDLAQLPFPVAQSLSRSGLGSLVAAPLQVESKIFGALLCARRQEESFSSDECEFLRQLSEHVALAAHQAQLYDAIRQAYDDLRQSQKAVLQQERLRAVGQMASGIAHDVNNAISPVTLYLETLLEDLPDLDPHARRRLEIIQRAIGDVTQTVARLREFSREREPQLRLLPVDLNELARQVAGLTHARWFDMAQQRGVSIDLRLEFGANLPLIMGVAGELRDAFVNLIFNAVDAMPEGGPLTLRTSLMQQPPSGAHPPTRFVRFEVIDAGIGMDEDTRRRCMEPFFTTKGERGTGLGLAMVYGAMQRHGTDIEIESAVGQGTTLRFSFPVPSAEVIGATSPAPTELPALHILVVDDDPLVAAAVSQTLRRDGHRVSTAEGGQAGIDAFLAARAQDDPFRVVISDLGMPCVDGRAVCGSVKAAEPGTLVILLTGWGQRLLADGDTPAHVDCVLGKPPTQHDLRAALARCLETGVAG